MTIGVIGRKVGMTRIFTDDGASVPVTVIEKNLKKKKGNKEQTEYKK